MFEEITRIRAAGGDVKVSFETSGIADLRKVDQMAFDLRV